MVSNSTLSRRLSGTQSLPDGWTRSEDGTIADSRGVVYTNGTGNAGAVGLGGTTSIDVGDTLINKNTNFGAPTATTSIDVGDSLIRKNTSFGLPAAPRPPAPPSFQPAPAATLPNASTGGTGMNANTDVSRIAADIMDRDSPLMRLAEARGMQTANRRGLMNSSIAVNSAQDAVLDQVVPMASQEAGQRFQSNRAIQDYSLSSLLSRQGYEQDYSLGDQRFGFETALSGQNYNQQRGLNEQNYGFERGLNEQNYGFERGLNEQNYGFERGLNEQNFGFQSDLNEQNFGFDIGRMDRETELAIGRDNNAFDNERILEETRIDAGREEAALDREFEREMVGIDWEGRFGLAELDGDIRRDLMDRESTMRERITRLENDLEAKGVSMDAFFTARNQYNSRVDQIMANPDLSAEERETQLQTALDYLDVDIQGIEDMYAIDLPWTDYQPAPAPVDPSQVRSDLVRIYEEVLGRDPDISGINAYEQAVLSGQMTIDDVREEIRLSQEGTGQVQGVQSDLTQLYRDIFNREPDPAGLDFWSNQVLSGNVTLQDVAENFQQEAAANVAPEPGVGLGGTTNPDANLSTQDKVNALRAAYQNILSREPDADGFRWWREQLVTGRATIAQMEAAFREEAARQ